MRSMLTTQFASVGVVRRGDALVGDHAEGAEGRRAQGRSRRGRGGAPSTSLISSALSAPQRTLRDATRYEKG